MISIKSEEEIKIIKEGGGILAHILEEIKFQVVPGVTTSYLNSIAEKRIMESGGEPSFKGYRGFPAALCTSVNEVIVHGVPSERVLVDGDIISLDLGLLYKGFHTDMAITVGVGEVDPEVKRLIRATKKALKRGIKKTRPRNTLGDIGNTMQRYVEGQGFSIVRELCGHGIGRDIHEDPQVLNYGKRHTGERIKEGMVFCIEPSVTMGDWKIKTNNEKEDNFGYKTKDGSLSAHFEHTLAITSNGCMVITELDRHV